MNPFDIITTWLKEETKLGCSNPDRIVLATSSKSSVPKARVVAIREINESGILFFTQRDTQKVAELKQNENVSAVIWLPMQQRQVSIEGTAIAISNEENLHYWQTMPHDRQLRFSAYAPTSGQKIESTTILEDKYHSLCGQYKNMAIPMSQLYCGFRIHPELISFYTLGKDSFSEVRQYTKIEDSWIVETISP